MPKSVFQDIYNDLKKDIEDGTYAYQSFLPSEAELTAHYGCSRSSVRRALRMLAEDGLVQSQQGKGVRVILNPALLDVSGYNGLETFNELSRRLHFVPHTDAVLLEQIVADEQLAETTGFAVGSQLTHIMRARSADGRRISTDESYYLSDEVPGLTLDIIADSVYAYLEGTLGIKIGTSKRTITVEPIIESDHTYIDLGDLNAVGVMRSHTFDADGIMIEYTESRQLPGFFAYHETAVRSQR